MEFMLDALIDSLKLLPFLFLAYVLIEVIEYFSASKIEHSKLLVGKYSTLFGAGFSLIPQCGFSVVATDLFTEKKLKIGTLLAIYIATSDEAIPILLMYPSKIISLLPLLLIKFVLAIIIGYSVDLIFKKYNEKRLGESLASTKNENLTNEQADLNLQVKADENSEKEIAEPEHHIGCCGHDIEEHKGSKVKQFLVHPLIHTLKIFVFILIVNIAFGGLVQLVTEEKLVMFLSKAGAFAPLISALIGLIPNCVSSVIITKLYVFGSIGFGACVAGLIVNAGIAFVVLFKQNKSIKENFAIISSMLLISIVTGYVIQLLGF